jgi:CheY-like chemotaxis protein
MTKKVLDVGQCGFDHPQIKRLIESNFDATVDRAHTAADAKRLAEQHQYDLITVNRVFDQDGQSGIELIKELKANQATAEVPVMLVSNYPDAQAEATQSGAVPGFGKNSLSAPETLEGLAAQLSS